MNKIFLPLFCLLFSSPVWAFRLTPMAVHFSPAGKKATQVMTLDNSGSEKVAVQMQAMTRAVSVDGVEKRTVTEDFTIYPEQVVLLPNEKRNVRVTWTGAAKFDSEKAFRIVASQLPLEFHDENSKGPKNNGSLKFLVQYVASVYVTPENAEAKVRVVAAKMLKPKLLEIEMNNSGTAHRLLRARKLQVFAGEKEILAMDHVKELDSENILAGATRKFLINVPHDISAKDINVKLALEDTAD
jgi:fimbrial chaperone protein